jgi:hypothetical protein
MAIETIPLTNVENDLQNEAVGRLQTWVKDTVWRMETGNVDPSNRVALCVQILMTFTAWSAICAGVNEETFTKINRELYRDYAKLIKKEGKNSGKSSK